MYIDLDKFKEYANICYEQVKDTKYDGIIAILNGGFYLADYLSKKMNIPIYTINIKSYRDKEQQGLKVLYKTDVRLGNYLIVDDIYDSGRTLKYAENSYKEHLKINNSNSKIFLDKIVLISKDINIKHGYYHNTNEWVDFFWESI